MNVPALPVRTEPNASTGPTAMSASVQKVQNLEACVLNYI